MFQPALRQSRYTIHANATAKITLSSRMMIHMNTVSTVSTVALLGGGGGGTSPSDSGTISSREPTTATAGAGAGAEAMKECRCLVRSQPTQ